MQVEDQALNMAIHFEKLRNSYLQLHSQYNEAQEENFQLEKHNKQLSTKHADIKSRFGNIASENEELKAQVRELENTLALMKEMVTTFSPWNVGFRLRGPIFGSENIKLEKLDPSDRFYLPTKSGSP